MRHRVMMLGFCMMGLVAVPVWAQNDEAQCAAKLKDTQFQLSITDNQRALAVRDLGTANRLIEEFRAAWKQAQADLAKIKAESAKKAEPKPEPKADAK